MESDEYDEAGCTRIVSYSSTVIVVRSTLVTLSPGATLWQRGISIRWNSSDTTLFNMSTAEQGPTVYAVQTVYPAVHRGLSAGLKASIGIGASAIGLLMVGMAVFAIRRRRRKQTAQVVPEPAEVVHGDVAIEPAEKGEGTQELPSESLVPELPARGISAEVE